ncbi:MAG: helix-turn-helix domain-containing protein [Gammaproteobacteria bacterium]|nr:MAG: helix-turn-helix domain-containing protein [Gammaproteobacteria bacterium]
MSSPTTRLGILGSGVIHEYNKSVIYYRKKDIMPHVTLLALEQALASSITLTAEMLNAADNAYRRRHRHSAPLVLACCSASRRHQASTASGLCLRADSPLPEPGATDLIILPALWRNPERSLRSHPRLTHWLQQQHAANTRICAVGSSASFLAQAGLLNGKPATTHWHDFGRFAKRYPDVHLQRRHLITRARNLYCAASINAVADLMIHFIQELYDLNTAREVESQFSPEIRSPYQQNLYSAEGQHVHHDELVATAQDWLREHLQEKVHFPTLADTLGISVRTFHRRFQSATGKTPLQYLNHLRIDSARDLLRHTDLSISEIAWQCGFTTASHFGASFRDAMQHTPKAYRQAVRGKLFSAQE